MVQIYFKDDYKIMPRAFEMFLKSSRALFEKGLVSRYIKAPNKLIYVVYCNDKNELEFYYSQKKEEKSGLLKSFLEILYTNEVGEVIESDFDLKKEMNTSHFCNSIYKYKTKEYQINSFDADITKYILTSMVPGTFIKHEIRMDHNDQLFLDLKVYGKNKHNVKSVSTVIQQQTAVDKNKSGRFIKLHVSNGERSENEFKIEFDQLMNFLFIPYNFPQNQNK